MFISISSANMDTAYLHITLNIFKYLKHLTYKALEGIAANYMSLQVYAVHKPTLFINPVTLEFLKYSYFKSCKK